ncbi:MAG: SdpI family protein [Nitrospirae bacterium]|nr:SdpI family protein [Nitrospirota bacterium]
MIVSEQPFIVPATILFIIAIPLIIDIIPRNRLYGVRTLKTLSDDEYWYKGNRFGGWAILITSLIYMLTAIIFPYNKASIDNFPVWQIHFGALVVSLLAGLLITGLYIKKL